MLRHLADLARIAVVAVGVNLAPRDDVSGWKDFREIVAWQRARELKIRVDELLQRPAMRLKFKFRDQLEDQRDRHRETSLKVSDGSATRNSRALRE
jgi:hypothetical protein